MNRMPDQPITGRFPPADKLETVRRQSVTYTRAREPGIARSGQEPPQGEAIMAVIASEFSRLPALIGVEQACTLLGISRSAGYRAAAAGDLPTIRLGRRLYVPTARLLTMLGLAPEVKP
jgi:excisionase family DNA binding protein